MTGRSRRGLAVLAAVALLAAGCGDDDDDGDVAAPTEEATTTTAAEDDEETTTTTSASEEGGQDLEVVAVDYAFEDVPAEIEGGLVNLTMTNDGAVAHEFGLVEIGDTPLATFLTDFPPVLEGGPFPEYADAVAVAGESPGEEIETSFLVEEGTYALFCALDGKAPEAGATTTTAAEAGPPGEGETGPAHFTLGMAQTLSVTAGAADAELPEAEGSIVAKDYSFEVDVKAGEQTVAFTNEGPAEIHIGVFFPFAEGVDEATAATVLDTFLASEDQSGPPPPELDFEAGEAITGIFSAGLGQTKTMSFVGGRTYAVICFISDRAGGPPHVIAHDMKKIFTVAE